MSVCVCVCVCVCLCVCVGGGGQVVHQERKLEVIFSKICVFLSQKQVIFVSSESLQATALIRMERVCV